MGMALIGLFEEAQLIGMTVHPAKKSPQKIFFR